ncbi:MAG: T9SS type A sorting domain-containing protein, partial [Bacteroidota bacterium]
VKNEYLIRPDKALGLVWTSIESAKVKGNQPLFTIHGVAKKTGLLSKLLDFDKSVEPIAYNGNGLQQMRIQLQAKAISNSTFVSKLNISPNPTNQEFSLNFNLDHAQHLEIEIFNLGGKQVFAMQNNFDAGIQKLDFTKEDIILSEGMYLVKLKGDGVSLIGKLMIVK